MPLQVSEKNAIKFDRSVYYTEIINELEHKCEDDCYSLCDFVMIDWKMSFIARYAREMTQQRFGKLSIYWNGCLVTNYCQGRVDASRTEG